MMATASNTQGRDSQRHVEPQGVVHTLSRWYFVCWDLLREDFRTFRVDRLSEPVLVEACTERRALPFGDLATFVAQSLGARCQHSEARTARIELLAPYERVVEWMPWSASQLTPLGKERCLLETHEHGLDQLALHLAMMDADFIVREPRELVDHITRLAERLGRSVQASVGGLEGHRR